MKALEKIKNNSLTIVLVLSLVLFLRQCGINRDLDKMAKDMKAMNQKMDSIPNVIEINRMIQIEGLKSSKRVLYDWNSVVRTAVRPDDRMNQYDKDIQLLEKK